MTPSVPDPEPEAAPPTTNESPDGLPDLGTFAERLTFLINTATKPGAKRDSKRARYSDRDLADLTGMSHHLVSELRIGTQPDPRLNQIIALADVFGVDWVWLAGEDLRAPQLDTFAQRLSHLIETTIKPSAKPGAARATYSDRELGLLAGMSHQLILQFRTGVAADPRKSQIQALANVFRVDWSWLAGNDNRTVVDDDPLSHALRRPVFRMTAARIANADLSDEALRAVAGMVDHIVTLETGRSRGPEPTPRDSDR